MKNITTPLGGICIIDKAEKDFGLISTVFRKFMTKEYVGRVKLLLNNRLTYATSIRQIPNTTSDQLYELLDVKNVSERSLYRTVEKVGRLAPIILWKYQDVIKRNNFVDEKQCVDWSSVFFEGSNADMAEFGYSKDKRPDRKQINFGISTGINGIPSALTIQNGNVVDQKHFGETYNVLKRILEKNTLLIFDCGANSKANKRRILIDGFNYLTMKAKKLRIYKKYVAQFNANEKTKIKINGNEYFAAKIKEGIEFQYIFFSEHFFWDQLKMKERKFKMQMKKGDELAAKAEKEKALAKYPSRKGWIGIYPEIQRILDEIKNPYINGIEGFFILESTVDADPEEILRIYKQRDAAEKLIRNLKEGIELRPIRHWTKYAIIGSILIAFLAESLINLTRHLCKNPLVKNTKLLKKYLMNLTVTFIYPENRFRFSVVSNVLPPISELFGDFWRKYETKNLDLRW